MRGGRERGRQRQIEDSEALHTLHVCPYCVQLVLEHRDSTVWVKNRLFFFFYTHILHLRRPLAICRVRDQAR